MQKESLKIARAFAPGCAPTHYFHKITLPGRVSRYSAWFIGDPMGRAGSLALLADGVRIDRAGRVYPLTDSEEVALTRGPWSAGQAGTF